MPGLEGLPGVPWELVPSLRSALELQRCETWPALAARSAHDLATLKYVTRTRAEELLAQVVILWQRETGTDSELAELTADPSSWDVTPVITKQLVDDDSPL